MSAQESVIYEGSFFLAWLLPGESVRSAGDGSGAAIVVAPDGSERRVEIGEVAHREPAEPTTGAFAEYLTTEGFPYAKLTDYNARLALDVAIGMLEDADLRADFAARAEEAIVESTAQAMEP